MDGGTKQKFKNLSDEPAHFKIENKFNIPEIDKFLLGPEFNFTDEKINLLLSKSYKKMSQFCVDAFEASVGVAGFNKHFYLPVKKFYNENFDEVFKSAQKNSNYDIAKSPDLLPQRLFVEAAFLFMQVDYNHEDKESLNHSIKEKFVQKNKPCVFVFNHPFGIIDTLIAARLTMQKRPDVKFMANALVGKLVPEISGLLLDLNVMINGSGSNSSTVDGAIRHLDKGGAIIMFPDPVLPLRKPWYAESTHAKQSFNFKRGLGQLIVGAPEAKISMVHLTGEFPNSRTFHGLGSVHPWVKLSMVLREFLKTKGNKTYKVYISKPLEQKRIQTELEAKKLEPLTQPLTDLELSKALAQTATKYVEKKYLTFKSKILNASE